MANGLMGFMRYVERNHSVYNENRAKIDESLIGFEPTPRSVAELNQIKNRFHREQDRILGYLANIPDNLDSLTAAEFYLHLGAFEAHLCTFRWIFEEFAALVISVHSICPVASAEQMDLYQIWVDAREELLTKTVQWEWMLPRRAQHLERVAGRLYLQRRSALGRVHRRSVRIWDVGLLTFLVRS